MRIKRFHQEWGLPFIPRPGFFVEIAQGRVRRFVGSENKVAFNARLENTTAEFHGRMVWFKPWTWFGYGDVTIAEGSRKFETIPHLICGLQLREAIDDYHAEREKEAARQRVPPSDTKFGDKVFRLPGLPEVLDRAMQDKMVDLSWHVKEMEWIARGDLLCTFTMSSEPGSAFNRNIGFDIKSPVSGLFIGQGKTGRSDNWSRGLATILLPEHGPTPISVTDTFQPLHTFFMKERGCFKAHTAYAALESALSEQTGAEYIIRNLSTYLQENSVNVDELLSHLQIDQGYVVPFIMYWKKMVQSSIDNADNGIRDNP